MPHPAPPCLWPLNFNLRAWMATAVAAAHYPCATRLMAGAHNTCCRKWHLRTAAGGFSSMPTGGSPACSYATPNLTAGATTTNRHVPQHTLCSSKGQAMVCN